MTHLQDGQTELSEQPFICLDFGFWSSGSAVSELVILVKLGAVSLHSEICKSVKTSEPWEPQKFCDCIESTDNRDPCA